MALRLPIALLSLGLVLGLGSCNSPTLPLPPPAPTEISASDEGVVAVRGQALENAFVACLNERLSKGVIVQADPDGRFSLEIEGQPDDDLTLWQMLGTEPSSKAFACVPGPTCD